MPGITDRRQTQALAAKPVSDEPVRSISNRAAAVQVEGFGRQCGHTVGSEQTNSPTMLTSSP